jgi:antitoxin FitA
MQTRMIQIRNVPDSLHRTLRERAARSGRSLSDYLLAELAELASRPTLQELFERISHREPVEPDEPTAAAVRAERDTR